MLFRRSTPQDILNALPGMIQQNITVKGMSWDEHADLNNQGASLRTARMFP